jgi:hypothetical protein
MALQIDFAGSFFTDWLYFRMVTNPTLNDKETRDEWGRWKNHWKVLLPPDFDTDYQSDIKITPWCCPPFIVKDWYVVEKKDGLTAIKWDYFTYDKITPIDTVHYNVSDSLYLYDNRFLAVNVDGRIRFYSGNIRWDDWRKLNIPNQLRLVAYIRGVQFGLQDIDYLKKEWIPDIEAIYPEYVDWDFVYSFFAPVLTHGRVIVTSPKGKALEYLEFLYYTDNPERTGDKEDVYYEMKYKLPTTITSIKERHLEKRKLTREEVKHLRETSLTWFFGTWKANREEIDDE